MFDLKLFRKQLEESRNIHECELPPLPEVEEGETYLFISYSRQDLVLRQEKGLIK